jgi:hypothetical protein
MRGNFELNRNKEISGKGVYERLKDLKKEFKKDEREREIDDEWSEVKSYNESKLISKYVRV